ncbi:hypothetical protein CSC94_08445 [Zhengella mangrovi]|uniref:DUF1858 domain-containing protein n=1 Tax=Zhengella mangrovi TaxID=1982044 RepID=A0A2G1QQB9_9HYPH|nr:DUF1858 domain-containing protein [Zhengella mangrovi]PHP67713.1 hypothetical protein CSC94_08445 [Zhengella mangrovi]
MAKTSTISIDMTIEDVMTTWPVTVQVVMAHGMFCVGCPISGFHTVADAAFEHAVDLETFTSDLARAIAASEEPG